MFEPITGNTFENRGEKIITIYTLGKAKQIISYTLCIFGNEMKEPYALKGLPEQHLENKLKKIKVVLEKVYIICKINA